MERHIQREKSTAKAWPLPYIPARLRLLPLIERANIFQLYWSPAAKRSRYVRQEWRHALKQKRDHFIRPLYWQVPMPQPPRELAQLHFSYIELDN